MTTYYWYSEKQKQRSIEMRLSGFFMVDGFGRRLEINTHLVKDGIEYTEVTHEGVPSGNWDDYQLVGMDFKD